MKKMREQGESLIKDKTALSNATGCFDEVDVTLQKLRELMDELFDLDHFNEPSEDVLLSNAFVGLDSLEDYLETWKWRRITKSEESQTESSETL
jgi:hypothetical protein